jgi:nitrate reductase cytochrome c-type subunit
VPADGWLLNTPNEDHHGDMFNADGGADNCSSCHWSDWMKKPFAEITPSRGWCFRCHYGTDGAGAGFVDPTQ